MSKAIKNKWINDNMRKGLLDGSFSILPIFTALFFPANRMDQYLHEMGILQNFRGKSVIK